MGNPRLIDISSQQFGAWMVLGKSGNTRGGGAMWRCACSCGTERTVLGTDLRNGKSKSCGCLSSRATIGARARSHGLTGTRLYSCWKGMHQRCRDTSNKNYGGKGITVCEAWHKFENFRDWAHTAGYRDDLTIERKENSVGYCPENCKWATKTEQARNRSIVRRCEDGRTYAEIAEESDVSITVMNNRIAAGGWTALDAATTPVGGRRAMLPRGADGKFTRSPTPWRR